MSTQRVVPMPARPRAVFPSSADQVPPELAEREIWVLWAYDCRNGKWTKCPKTLSGQNASTVDPSTWATLAEVLEARERFPEYGIGTVFPAGEGLVGVDFDNCLNPDGSPKEWLRRFLERFPDTYWEVSPSGRGVKIWFFCDPPEGFTGRRRPLGDGQVEVYTSGRFFTFTGRVYRGAPLQVDHDPNGLDFILKAIGADTTPPPAAKSETVNTAAATPAPLPEEQLRMARTKLELLRETDPSFNRLWIGGTFKGSDGKDNPSGGDMSVCNKLAMIEMAAGEIDALFRESERMRPKWDTKHFADGRTYGQATVAEAVRWAEGQRAKDEARERASKPTDTTLQALNAMPIFADHGLVWARFEIGSEQIFGYTTEGQRVTFPTMADLLTFSRAQQAIARYTRIMLFSPPPKKVRAVWEPAVALIMKLAVQVSSDDQGNDLQELLPLCFERAGRPQASDAGELYGLLLRIQAWERDPHAIDGRGPFPGPFVFVYQGHCFVNAHKLRLWASLPRVTNTFLKRGEVARDLEMMGFQYRRQFDVHHQGKRVQMDLWAGPVDALGAALDAPPEVEQQSVTDVTDVTDE
ncbi:MAG: hypothetical protein JNK87_36910 [Bryobacterales bacterium]|nr:hypothetical protein [Bryobacterales bacterium]